MAVTTATGGACLHDHADDPVTRAQALGHLAGLDSELA